MHKPLDQINAVLLSLAKRFIKCYSSLAQRDSFEENGDVYVWGLAEERFTPPDRSRDGKATMLTRMRLSLSRALHLKRNGYLWIHLQFDPAIKPRADDPFLEKLVKRNLVKRGVDQFVRGVSLCGDVETRLARRTEKQLFAILHDLEGQEVELAFQAGPWHRHQLVP
jgi:hypothetical protein